MEGHGQDLEETAFFSVMESGIPLVFYNSYFPDGEKTALKILFKTKGEIRERNGDAHMDNYRQYFSCSW